jgi:hypothetical protein
LILKARNGTEKYYDDSFVERCVDIIAKKPLEVFSTSDFLKIDEKTMLFIVENPNLQIGEYELLQNVLIWGKNKLTLKENKDKTLNDILTKEIMQKIRWPLIPLENLFGEIRESGLIPEDEWIDTLEINLLEDGIPEKYQERGNGNYEGINVKFEGSNLLKPKWCSLLAKWTGIKKNWKLLYQASVDGFSANNFRLKCQNQGPTISVIKSENGNIFGG